MSKSSLDEMQVQRRNNIGNQTFMLMFYLLMIDIGLYGFGIRWLQYPLNVFIIILTCMSYYLVRLIWNDAYVGPASKSKASVSKTAFVSAIAGFIIAIVVYILQRKLSINQVQQTGNGGAVLLFVFSSVAMIIALVTGIIKKRRNRDSGE